MPSAMHETGAVASISSDCGSNVKKAIISLGVPHAECMGHKANNAMTRALGITKIGNPKKSINPPAYEHVKRSLKINNHFAHSADSTVKLRAQIEQNQALGNIKGVSVPGGIRWDSMHDGLGLEKHGKSSRMH